VEGWENEDVGIFWVWIRRGDTGRAFPSYVIEGKGNGIVSSWEGEIA